jgi:hypothetical protein
MRNPFKKYNHFRQPYYDRLKSVPKSIKVDVESIQDFLTWDMFIGDFLYVNNNPELPFMRLHLKSEDHFIVTINPWKMGK